MRLLQELNCPTIFSLNTFICSNPGRPLTVKGPGALHTLHTPSYAPGYSLYIRIHMQMYLEFKPILFTHLDRKCL